MVMQVIYIIIQYCIQINTEVLLFFNKIPLDFIQKQVYNSLNQEVTSKEIGEMVMNGLKDIDEVAYVRFASVYRSFKDISTFMRELEKLTKK